LRFRSRSAAATRAAGAALGRAADEEGGGECLVVALAGPLGAGKTEFVRGLAEGLEVDPKQVASPTFAIAWEYPRPGGSLLVHADLYRVESEAEFEAAGFRDWLRPGAVVAVEWADRLPGALPDGRIEVRLARVGGDEREVEVRAWGATSERVVRAFAARCGGESDPWR
jgi:tRNA threonylcarbamoyladenosine biosynthesis protein TsaE